MSFLTKEPVQRAEKYLKEFDTNLEVISLETSARTAAEAASSLKCEVGAIVKSLLFSADDKFILCLVSGDKKASLNKLKKGATINELYELLYKYERMENYDACAGIHKAIKSKSK